MGRGWRRRSSLGIQDTAWRRTILSGALARQAHACAYETHSAPPESHQGSRFWQHAASIAANSDARSNRLCDGVHHSRGAVPCQGLSRYSAHYAVARPWQNFSKVLSIVPFYSTCTRPLTFKNFCQGTTACAVLVCKETVFVGYVGDSQAVICRLNTPIVLNKPHKTSDDRERRCVLRVSIVCLSCSTLPLC